jgi:spermidine synthase
VGQRYVGLMGSRSATILFIAFASGVAALLYQMVWMRWFQILFGSSAYAASATLCVYFAGLALGAEFFGRRSSRMKRPLIAYACLEAAAAVVALGVPLVFDVYDAIYPYLY